jgi:hypothetical protein
MKKVTFSNNITIYVTYSPDEYDRLSIDHVLYRKAYNRVSNEEMMKIYITLDIYKLYEMTVNKDSLHNTCYQAKKFVTSNNQ